MAKRNQSQTPPRRLLSVAEVAEYLGVSRQSVYNTTGPKAATKFPVKPKRIGRLIKCDRREIDAYIESL